MHAKRILSFIASMGAVFSFIAIVLYALHHPSNIQQNIVYSYQGPTQAVPGNPLLIRIEILVRDSPEAGGVQIKNVEFNGQGIPLKPRDIYGDRGSASFQIPPGKYKLRWQVQRDKLIWPRVVTHEELVNVDSRDLWLQIEIIGNDASIR